MLREVLLIEILYKVMLIARFLTRCVRYMYTVLRDVS